MTLFEPVFNSILSSGHPYLNPGTGGLIIQLLLGALFAIGLTARIFWSRIKKIFGSNRSVPTAPVAEEKDETR